MEKRTRTRTVLHLFYRQRVMFDLGSQNISVVQHMKPSLRNAQQREHYVAPTERCHCLPDIKPPLSFTGAVNTALYWQLVKQHIHNL